MENIGKDHLEDLGVDGKKVFKWTLKKQNERMWAGLSGRVGAISGRVV